MKKLTVFCLIITLILASGCIGWAASNSSDLLSDEAASLELSKIKVKATNIYKLNQKDVIETITFPVDPIHPNPGDR